jgi:hypothetical protein
MIPKLLRPEVKVRRVINFSFIAITFYGFNL